MGMFDFSMDNLDDPKKQALLMLAAGLLSPVKGKGWSGFGEAAGRGITGGLMGFNEASQNQRRNALTDIQKKMSQMQLDASQRETDFNARNDNLASQFFQAPSQQDDYSSMQYGQGNPGKADLAGYAAALPSLGGRGIDKAVALQQALAKDSPWSKVDPKDYTPESVRKFAATKDFADLKPRVKMEGVNTGAGTTFVDPYAVPQGASIPHSMSPDAVDASKRGWAGQAQSERHFQAGQGKPVFNEAAGGFIVPPTGQSGPSLIPVPGVQPTPKNQPSEAELTAAGYASRMIESNKILSALPLGALPGITQVVMASKYPTAAPYSMSSEQQQYRQAQEDWVRAKLRKESGAVIAADEMDREIRTYFPQPGEKAGVIKQKAEARLRAQDSMMMAAGKASGKVGASPSGFRVIGRE